MTFKRIKTIKQFLLLYLFSCSFVVVSAQQKDSDKSSSGNIVSLHSVDSLYNIAAFSRAVKNSKAAKAEMEWRGRIYNSIQDGLNPIAQKKAPAGKSPNDSRTIKVTKPYVPLQLTGNEISLPGRKVRLNPSGFPEKLQSFFSPDLKGTTAMPKNIITEAIHFHVINSATHKDIKFKNAGITVIQNSPGIIKWSAVNSADALKMEVGASIVFDGFLSYLVKITALQDVQLDDIKLHLPINMETSRYLLGLGNKNVIRPDTVKWKWNMATKHDGAWIGIVNAGLQYSLQDDQYTLPAKNNSLQQQPLQQPVSWGNNDKGGILVTEKGTSMLSENYSGARTMKKGDVLYFNFAIMITPLSIDDKITGLDRFYWDGKL
jgi:hypothetical protein